MYSNSLVQNVPMAIGVSQVSEVTFCLVQSLAQPATAEHDGQGGYILAVISYDRA